jgi:hypothetical protein
VIDGLRVAVRHVVTLHRQGQTILEIAEALGITEAQVFHALRQGKGDGKENGDGHVYSFLINVPVPFSNAFFLPTWERCWFRGISR